MYVEYSSTLIPAVSVLYTEITTTLKGCEAHRSDGTIDIVLGGQTFC